MGQQPKFNTDVEDQGKKKKLLKVDILQDFITTLGILSVTKCFQTFAHTL